VPNRVLTFDHYGVYTGTDRCIVQKMSWFSLVASRHSGAIVSCRGICVRPPFLGFYALEVDQLGWPLGLVPTGSENDIGCQ
jgi:hypothetical protein